LAVAAEPATAPITVHAARSAVSSDPVSDDPVSSDSVATEPSQRVDGRVAATIIAAAVGCAAFGIAVVLAESISMIKQLFTLSTAVGPLSGKAVAAVAIYPIAWMVLHAALRKSQTKITTVRRWTIILMTIGLLGTFPPFYGLIAGH
jgi:hypothetical protein